MMHFEETWMLISRANALCAAGLLGLGLLAFQGCQASEPPDDIARGGGGATSSGNGASHASGGASLSGGAAGDVGNAAGQANHGNGCGDPSWFACNSDANCTSASAKADATCTIDCTIPCGFEQLGTKVCSCVGGVYAECPCPRPANFLGEGTAKYCDDPAFPSATESGLMEAMKGLPCDTEWQQCIARDVPPGSTPRGCVCMTTSVTPHLRWVCGSTNKWFFPE